MREIKFRSWDPFNGTMSPPNDVNGNKKDLGWFFSQHDNANEGGNDCKLMQFAGLKDKNGKEIYEGDIISAAHFTHPLIVGYNTESASFCCNKTNDFETQSCYWFYNDVVISDGWIVIGNIYENPELLKGLNNG